MQQELKDQSSKQQKSRGMNLSQSQHQKQLNTKNINSQLSSVGEKKEERKIDDKEIDYLVQQFAIVRNKAVNLLRKMELKECVKYLVHS